MLYLVPVKTEKKMILSAIFCFALLCLSSLTRVEAQQETNVTSNATTLSLAVFISTGGSFTGGTDVGRPFVEAVNFAVELINNDTQLLPGYKLSFEITDSQVSKLS